MSPFRQWARRHRLALPALAAGVALLTMSCRAASRPPATSQVALPADALVDRGCYTCLIEAREAYDALPPGLLRSSRLFVANVLIGLRESELAMDPTMALDRARALEADLPPAADAGFVIDLARAVPPDGVGTPRADLTARLDAARRFLADHPDAAVRLARAAVPDVLRQYLTASLPCLTAAIGQHVDAVSTAPMSVPPVVEYRLSTCPVVRPDALEQIADRDSRFVEAAYFLARAPTLQVTAALVEAQRGAFDRARAALPSSASVAYSVASLLQTTGDCRSAVAAYDAVLAVAPHHEAAALQRIVCLGYDRRHENAINAATTAITAGLDVDGEFHYWRAWNRHQLRQLPEAAADIDIALRSRRDAEAFALGGIVRYDLDDLPAAERHLSTAVQLDDSQCLARWYLGLVAFARELWLATGDDFTAAAECYRQSVQTAEAELAALERANLEPATREHRAASLRARMADDRNQEHASSLNAAIGFARSGDAPRARAMLAVIPDDSPHAAGAREIARFLDDATSANR